MLLLRRALRCLPKALRGGWSRGVSLGLAHLWLITLLLLLLGLLNGWLRLLSAEAAVPASV